MIRSVTLKNFRGLDSLTVPLNSATMLTGINGVGKTSVLEGLYCLFSNTRLDVAPLSRYNKSQGLAPYTHVGMPFNLAARQTYNYKLFWDECPIYGCGTCSVEAASTHYTWHWQYQKGKYNDLDKDMIINNMVHVDAATEFALWQWDKKGESETITTRRAQVLNPDGGLYLLPIESDYFSMCQYIDFSTISLQPTKLSFQTAKQLTKALQILNPKITDVRLKDIDSGLSVIVSDKYEVSLSTIGNGAVTWASALISIFELVDLLKLQEEEKLPVFVLFDEMGSGIHYSIMLEIWDYLKKFLEQNKNIQFVFNSHSDDCIRAFCEAFRQTKNASIVRLHQSANNSGIIPTEYTSDEFENIIAGEWEVRG